MTFEEYWDSAYPPLAKDVYPELFSVFREIAEQAWIAARTEEGISVRIKSANKNNWYYECIGLTFRVKPIDNVDYFELDSRRTIFKNDCEVISSETKHS